MSMTSCPSLNHARNSLSVSALVNDARVAANLGPCLYVKPVNGGLGLLSNQCVLNMLF